MPELPEVETIIRRLRDYITGLTIRDVLVNWRRSIAVPDVEEFVGQLRGRTISAVGRRGKYIILTLEPEGYLCLHLRMTGRLIYMAKEKSNHPLSHDPHCHVIFRFTSGDRLFFRDTRKFGRLYLVADPSVVTAGLGMEPLDEHFTADVLMDLMRGKQRQLKPMLLDQHSVAGLGNIYVDETLWLAGLHPLRKCNTLERGEIERLHAAMVNVLNCALENHGTTLRDYRDPDERPGDNESCLEVYGRAGQPCARCGGAIERIVVAQRSSHICPRCQR